MTVFPAFDEGKETESVRDERVLFISTWVRKADDEGTHWLIHVFEKAGCSFRQSEEQVREGMRKNFMVAVYRTILHTKPHVDMPNCKLDVECPELTESERVDDMLGGAAHEVARMSGRPRTSRGGIYSKDEYIAGIDPFSEDPFESGVLVHRRASAIEAHTDRIREVRDRMMDGMGMPSTLLRESPDEKYSWLSAIHDVRSKALLDEFLALDDKRVEAKRPKPGILDKLIKW